MFFTIKILISAFVIAFASSLAGKKPIIAGFIIALPLVSMLSIFFAYWEYRDMNKINEFATSILVAVPLSLVFFIPFLLNRWLKLDFVPTFILAMLLLALAYFIHHVIMRSAS